MKTSASGLSLLKAHEGCRLKAYMDTGGVWTIGYGHTEGVRAGDTCTQAQAEAWLVEDVVDAEKQVGNGVRVPLTQNQFDALVSLVYNIGGGAFFSSTLLRKLNAGDYTGAAGQFTRWIFDNGMIVNGLVLRRSDERALFLTGIGD